MSDRLRAIVVDDERPARRGLAALLNADGRVEVVATCARAAQAVDAIRSLQPDVVFLDIEMPGGDGFSVLEDLDDPAPAVVFVTAWDHYAARAFDVAALDYLLKPYSDERLSETVTRLVRRGPVAGADAIRAAWRAVLTEGVGRARPTERVAVRRPGRTSYLEAERIDWMRADGDYVELHTGGERPELVRGPLARLVADLGRERFLRTHRSWAVRIAAVRVLRVRAGGTAVLELEDGTEVPVSARRRGGVERALDGRGGG